MRGRKPHTLTIDPQDAPILQQVARRRSWPWFLVQRARIVLAVADGWPIQAVAWQVDCDPSTVWRVCRRYERGGLEELFSEAPRPGRPPRISPPPASPNC